MKRREIFSLFLLFLFVFVSGSLLTFSPEQLYGEKGLFGIWGVKTSHYLLQAFGYGTVALLFFILLWAVSCWKEERIWLFQRLVAMLFFTASASAILSAFVPSGIYASGGTVGEVIFRAFSPLMGRWGVLLAGIFLLLLSLYSFSNFSLRRAFSYINKFFNFILSQVVLEVKVPISLKETLPTTTSHRKKERKRKKPEVKKPEKKEPELFSVIEFQEPPLDFLRAPDGDIEIDRKEIEALW